MNQSAKPLDVGARIQNALRVRGAVGANLGGYTCPLCGESFHAGPKLWEHAKHAHITSTDVSGSADETQAKRDFIERARRPNPEAGQHRAFANKADPKPEASFNEYSHTQAAIGEGANYSDKTRPRSAPVHPESKRQSPNARALPSIQHGLEEPSEERHPSNNPRKRGTEDGPNQYGLHSDLEDAGIVNMNSQHYKTISAGSLPHHMNRGLPGSPPVDVDARRNTLGTKKPLWEADLDIPVSVRRSRRDKHQDFNNSSRRIQDKDKAVADNMELSAIEDYRGPSQDRFQDTTVANVNVMSSEPVESASNVLERFRGRSREHSPAEEHPETAEEEPEMLLQPETRPISHEQLVVEVKGIYAGLVMVEAKCIDIDERQSLATQEKDPTKRLVLKNDQWQSLIALHKQLLHEHHDFFLASQHPSASPALSRLAAKYSMPARMWRHGIHAFLEVLRHRLPGSLEHMLAFIYIAYSMMALLYETVPAFEDTWIECLGDLGRYRMAIEDDEPKDREVWSNVSRFWYNKASDKSPSVGRLYHHLAILARPYTWEQLSLYARSLTCITPFESARGSIMTLFNPILQGKDSSHRRSSSLETIFIRAHAILFTHKDSDSQDSFQTAVSELEREGFFENYLVKAGPKFKETGVYAAISNVAALFEYGRPREGTSKPILRKILDDAKSRKDRASTVDLAKEGESLDSPIGQEMDLDETTVPTSGFSLYIVSQASRLVSLTFAVALKRPKDKNVYPLVHVYLVFLWSLAKVDEATELIERCIPWIAICSFLNALVPQYEAMKSKNPSSAQARLESADFPRPEAGTGRPLAEDFPLRGQVYTADYFPGTWFSDAGIDDDERSLDLPSMNEPRVERILWLGHRHADTERHIRYDKVSKRFSTTDYVNDFIAADPIVSVSMNHDSVMSDARPIEDASQLTDLAPSMSDPRSQRGQATPETASLAPSESLDNSMPSTRASTPTAINLTAQPAAPSTPIAIDPNESMDTPMVDVSPGKDQPQKSSKNPRESTSLASFQRVGAGPESPPQITEAKDKVVDDPKKIEIMKRFDESADEIPQGF